MIRFDATETIGRPVAEVFAFIADPKNEPAWHTDAIEVRYEPPGPAGAGKVLHGTYSAMGKRSATADISAYEQDRLIQVRFRTPTMGILPTITLTTEPDGGGTRLTRRLEIQPLGVMRILAPLMSGSMTRSNAAFVANARRLLESSAAA